MSISVPRAPFATDAFDRPQPIAERLFVILSATFLATVLIRTAWIADAAAIDLRVVQNFVSGYGPRWNVVDRVQAYTDPLWVLLVSAVDVFLRQPYVAVWVLSLLLTIGTAVLIASQIAVDAAGALIALLALMFSKAFVEYSVSGFQTPLTVAIVTAFWVVYWKARPGQQRLTALVMISALCALTDIMATVVVIPGLITAAGRLDNRGRAIAAAVGVVPLIVWMMFAFVYYGFVLPNPWIAAWHAPWPLAGMVRQGAYYLLDAVSGDPLTVCTIAAAVAAEAFGLTDSTRPLVAGLIAFMVVLVISGGDSLSGRSLVPAFVGAVLVLARCEWLHASESVAITVGVIAALGLVTPGAPVLSDADFGKNAASWERWRGEPAPPVTEVNHIRDERRLSYQTTGLLKGQLYVPLPDTSRVELTMNAARAANQHVVTDDAVGLLGVVAGPGLDVIDPLGRGDALLARIRPREPWRPGGVPREIPAGYGESLERNQNRIADPKLAAEWDALRTVTSGPIFSRARLRALIRLHLGFTSSPAARTE